MALQRIRSSPLIILFFSMTIGGLGNTLLATSPEDPWLFMSLRFMFACLMLSPWVLRGFKLPHIIKLAGLLEVLSIVTLVLALSTVSVALATVIGSFAPLVSIAANKISGHQHIPRLILVPSILGIVAATLIASQKPFDSGSLIGIGLVVLSFLMGTAGSIINGWYGSEVPMWDRVSFINTLGAIFLTPYLFFNLADSSASHPSIQLLIYALIAALLPGTIAKGLNMYVLKHVSVPVFLQASTISLVSATITAWLILGQTLNIVSIVGVAFGVSGVLFLGWISRKERI